ncbi:MAG TPA: hypothetical protein DEP38_08305, partial [Cyanobacteria bacterium UBA9226]|nr:hypothetical protein [Cyanobacteria bacterium UBA9226]
EEENRNWGVSDTWEETILNRIDAIIDTSGFLTISSIMTHILGLELKAQSRAEQMRIADILRSNGFTQARVGGVRGWKREVVNEVVNSEFSTVQCCNQPTNLATVSEALVEIVPSP